MVRWRAWGLIGLSMLLPAVATGDNPASVAQTGVQVDGQQISRFTLRFSAPMVPLGSVTPPLTMDCAVPGDGRWADPATFVWSFARPLPGDTICRAQLRPDLKTLAGAGVSGTQRFLIDSGGPKALAVLPASGDSEIEEDQSFFVATNGPADRASVAAGAYCTVDGIGEKIAVDLLPPAAAASVLPAVGDGWRRDRFLEAAGLPSPLPAQARERAEALRNVVGLRCRRPLPPGRDMALVWGGGIHAPGGHSAGKDQRFDFTVRKAFSAKLTCSRANPRAGCNPIEAVTVEFTAPVPRAAALAARLDVGGGRLAAPASDGHGATLESVSFKAPLPPAITARLILPPDLRDQSGRPLDNGARFPLDVAIDEAPPLVKFAAPFGILEAKQGGVLPVTVRNVEPALAQGVKGVAGGSTRIAADDKTIADWIRRVDKAQDPDFQTTGEGKTERTVNHTGDRPLLGAGARPLRLALPGKGRDFEVVGVPLTQPGFYVVELASPRLGRVLLGRPATRYVSAAALVTDMAVHFKWGRAASLAWVTSLDSGAPVAGAAVRVTDSCSGKLLASGTTDATGRLLVPPGLPAPSTSTVCGSEDGDPPPLMVSARAGDDYSFVLTSWGEGIRPYDFDLAYGWSPPEPIFHAILDRTLLRAGETLHLTHVYRRPVAAGFASGGAVTGKLVFQHRGSETRFEQPVRLDGHGLGESSWTPPKGAPNGDYDLSLEIGETTISSRQSVRVDEYRLPTMRASVSGPKAPAIHPQRLPVDMFVGYLSGGGAGHAPVKLRTAWEALDDNPAGWDGWTFGGAAVVEGVVPLDQDESRAAAPLPPASTIPLALDGQGALRTTVAVPALATSARLRLEMDYQDANGETLTASGSLPVYAAAVRLGIKPDGWLQRSGDLRLKIAALDTQDKVIAGQRVTVVLYTREILSARRRLIGGFYAYDNTARTTRLAGSCSGTTDAHGLVACALDPDVSGEVIAVATTKDADGNEARAVSSIYLAGDDDWWFGGDNGDRMDILPDAKAYRGGDVAHVQVRMPFRQATALVTVEREGVLSSFVTTLSGKDPVVDVPLPAAYAPDVFISVTAVRGRIGGWRLWLADLARRWHLPFFSREGASPTALVDLAKPSYRIGIAKVQVGWEAHALTVAVKPEHQRYHVRDHARVVVRVAGPDGHPPRSAEIAFVAVDQALLQLSPNDSWDLLGGMMADRPLSVLTSTAQMQVVGKRHYGRKAVATGGGGGGDLSALTRADFRPVLLWRGRVPLDANGRAALVVPLADSLSAYKLVAVATAGPNLFGTGSAEIRTVQDLAIYPGVPPLVRTGDFFAATFTLRNGSDRPLAVRATVDLQPRVAVGAAIGVTIPPGGAMPVTWRLKAPERAGPIRWTVSARSSDGRSADRVTIEQQVVPAIPEAVWAATLLRVGPDTQLPLMLPSGALPGRGGIDVMLAATPAPPLDGVRTYMRAYPYDCFEQRLSKAIALGDAAAWTKQMSDLPAYVSSNGLLRYWPNEGMSGSIALTAYALSITAEAGLAWPPEEKTRLIAALRGVVDGRIGEDGYGDKRLLRVAALAALARNGAATPAMLAQMSLPIGKMPTALLADWLVALDKVPGADPAMRAAAEAALRNRIVYEGTRLDLVDRASAPWWMMVSDDEMALKALLAVTGRPGWADDAPRMMVGVALRQRQGHWDTTPANAWGTLAARRFAAAYPGAPSGTARIGLAGRTIAHSWPTSAPIRLPLGAGGARLGLSAAQPGPWATVSVRAAVPLTAPAFAGYRIAHEVSFLQRAKAGQLSRGDVLKVRITVEAPVARNWVVIEDPIPAGASIVGGNANQSALLAAQAGGGTATPDYIDRGLDAWRGYFGWLEAGTTTIDYVVRINSPGRFSLPPTRVEAMYSPEIHAALPNRPVVVVP